jgi:hypothetical protein
VDLRVSMHLLGLQCIDESKVPPWSGLLQQLFVRLQPLLRHYLRMRHVRVGIWNVRAADVGAPSAPVEGS